MNYSKHRQHEHFSVAHKLFVACLFFLTLSACSSSDDGFSGNPFDDPTATPPTTSGGLAAINTGKNILGFIPINKNIVMLELERSGTETTGVDETTLSIALSTPIATSFAVDSCSADNNELSVVCVGYRSSMVAIVDLKGLLSAGAAPDVIEIDTTADSSQSFSGGSCINCGVLTDTNFKQFMVSSSDGYRVFDYAGVQKASYLSSDESDPPRDLATENFSFDPIKRLIISPEYNSSTNQHLYLINVDSGIIYRWEKRMVSSTVDETLGLESLNELGISRMTADSAAVDASTGILTISDEYTNGLLILNLNSATYDDEARTFTAIDSAIKLENVTARALTTGQAIEPASSLLFLEDEFGKSMGVVRLPSSASPADKIAVSEYTSANIPRPGDACPNTGAWRNVGDPHGLAIFTSNLTGNDPKGLLINSSKNCAAVVDLKKLLAAPKSSEEGSNQVDTEFDLIDSGTIRFVEVPQP